MDTKTKKRKLSFIAGLRKAFVRSTTYFNVMTGATSDKTGPRGGVLFVCAICNKAFPKNRCEVDHEDPLTPYHLFQYEMSEKMVLERLFCEISNLRVLCKDICHATHTKNQRKLRSIAKKKRKNEEKEKI